MLEAIILAAGESRRMGQLKPLLKINELTFLQKIHKELIKEDIQDVHIVLGYQAEKIKRECGIEADFIINENYKNGQFSSLQQGILSLSPECSAVLVCLVDQPHINSSWIDKLIIPVLEGHLGIVRPSYNGRHGHPVIYTGDMFPKILEFPPTATAKDVMSKYSSDIFEVEIDSEGILYDADTPEDLQIVKNFI